MSQRVVEGLLGRLVTDREFRRMFFENPAGTCLRESLDLTGPELEALLALDQGYLVKFAKELDARIVRASLTGAYTERLVANGSPTKGPTIKPRQRVAAHRTK